MQVSNREMTFPVFPTFFLPSLPPSFLSFLPSLPPFSLPPSLPAPDLVSFKLDREELVVSKLFQLFNSVKTQVGILDWGIKMTTLEDGDRKSVV